LAGQDETAQIFAGIGRLPDEAPEDLPGSNRKAATPAMVLPDLLQPDAATLPGARKRKCASRFAAVGLLVIVLMGDPAPAVPIRRRLDEPRFQMPTGWITSMRADCSVCSHNPLFLKLGAKRIVPCVGNSFFLFAKNDQKREIPNQLYFLQHSSN
jgi:hypothetical protein